METNDKPCLGSTSTCSDSPEMADEVCLKITSCAKEVRRSFETLLIGSSM